MQIFNTHLLLTYKDKGYINCKSAQQYSTLLICTQQTEKTTTTNMRFSKRHITTYIATPFLITIFNVGHIQIPCDYVNRIVFVAITPYSLTHSLAHSMNGTISHIVKAKREKTKHTWLKFQCTHTKAQTKWL